MLHILIGDGHAVFRRGTRDLLMERYSSIVIEEADNGHEMLRLAQERPWDLFIMDVSMPGKCGTDLLEELRRVSPSTPVLAFSVHPKATYALRMMRSGASGYLNKATSPQQLMNAIDTILSGRHYVSPEVGECLVARLQAPASGRQHDVLSNREFQVLRMLASGRPLKEIAGELCISANTISTYRGRVLEKLGLKNNADLARYAMEHSLIE